MSAQPLPTRVSSSPLTGSEQPVAWHALEPPAVLERMGSSPEGLSEAEARKRQAQYGPNELPRAKAEGPLKVLWRQIDNPLIWVLLGSGGLALALGKVADGAVVLAVVVVLKRLLAAKGLQVEEAALTGESVPVQKGVAAVPAEVLLGDRTSLAFGGTVVTSGTATGVVVATGGRTDSLGGESSAESKPGGGSTFRVKLPVAAAAFVK